MAKIVVRYVDGFTEEFPIRGGQEVTDWTCPASDLPNAKAAWTGPTGQGFPGTLYMTSWKNPKPNNIITSISITSECKGIPVLVAATAVKPGPVNFIAHKAKFEIEKLRASLYSRAP